MKKVHLSHKVSFLRQFCALVFESTGFRICATVLACCGGTYGLYRFGEYLDSLPKEVAKAIMQKIILSILYGTGGVAVCGLLLLLGLFLRELMKQTTYLTNIFRDAPLSLEEMSAIGANTNLERLLVMSCYLLLPDPLLPETRTFSVREYKTKRILPKRNPMFKELFPYSDSYIDSLADLICREAFPEKAIREDCWDENEALTIARKGKHEISEDVREWCKQILEEHHVLENYKQQSHAERFISYNRQPYYSWRITTTPFLLLFPELMWKK